jgi:C4-dicarboxylate-specific signal transduction histidine kinase
MGSYGRRLLAALLSVTCIQSVGAASMAAEAQPPPGRATVLVLIPVQPGRPLFDLFARGVAAEVLRRPSLDVVLSFEQLYGATDSEAVAQRQAEFVKAKYQGHPIAAIIAVGHPRYVQVRERLGLPTSVPLIFMAEGVTRLPRPPNAVFIDVATTLVDSWAYMRPMFGKQHRVAVLGGSAPADRRLSGRTVRILRQSIGYSRVIDLTNLAFEEIPERVAALPRDTVVLLDSTVADRHGRPMTSQSVLTAIRPVLRLPTLVSNDAMLGQGVLGGLLYRIEDLGRHAAATTARVLDGTPPDTLPIEQLNARAFIDARELERLGLPLSRVPPGATVLWRDPGTWEEYRSWILATVTLVLLQTALIAGLLAERRRRFASQVQLAERLKVQALVADISTGFANLSGDRLEAQIVSSLKQLGQALDTEDCAIWALRGPDGRSRRMFGWPERVDGATEGSLLDEALLTWARPRLDNGEEVQISNVTDRPIRSRTASDRAVASFLLLPLRTDGEVIGVLALSHAFSPDWSAHVLGDLRTIGEIIATASVRKRTDASMRRQLETLAHVNRVASLGELAASIAHELNQPLAAILSNAEVAQQLLALPDPPLDELREIVNDLIVDDERAGEIIRNMRSMLRKVETDAAPVDVNAVATGIMRLLTHDAQLRGGSLDVELGECLPTVTIDATQLTQVLLNLVVNAVDAMAAVRVRRAVSLQTRAADGGVTIAVRDHGPGILPDEMPRLFEPFFTTKPEGLGVGLAISRSILEAAGGRIRAENAADGGARFLVWLPASRSVDAEDGLALRPPA